MKLKILSICSIISLIYGDSFCSARKIVKEGNGGNRVVENKKNRSSTVANKKSLEVKNQKGYEVLGENDEKENKYPEIEKEFDKKRVSEIEGAQTDDTKMIETGEDGEWTKVSYKKRKKRSSTVANKKSSEVETKNRYEVLKEIDEEEDKYLEKYPEIEKGFVKKRVSELETRSRGTQADDEKTVAYEDDYKNDSISKEEDIDDAKTVVNEDVYKNDFISKEKDTEQFKNFSRDFKKFVESEKNKSSELLRTMDEFEQKITELQQTIDGKLEGTSKRKKSDSNSKVSIASQLKDAESLKEEIADVREKEISDQIEALNQIQQTFEDLNINKKINQLKNNGAKIDEMIEKIDNILIDIETKQKEIKQKRTERKQKRLDDQDRRKQRRQEKEELNYQDEGHSINWEAIEKYNETLSLFSKAVKNHKLRFTTVQKYGKQCFDDQDGRALFDPSQKMDLRLKRLCKQIYDVRFSEAAKIWSEIKEMSEKDSNYATTLEQLRSKVTALSKNITSLITQKQEKKRKSDSVSENGEEN